MGFAAAHGEGASERKAAIRQWVWGCLEQEGLATLPRPVYGRIPNFKGAHLAAARLAVAAVGRPEGRRGKERPLNPEPLWRLPQRKPPGPIIPARQLTIIAPLTIFVDGIFVLLDRL